MATINDKFNKVSDGTGVYPSVASVSVAREKGGDTLTCDDLAGWPKESVAFFSTFRQNPDGTIDTSTQSDWKGIVQDNVITSVTRLAGAEDSGQLVGDKVMQNPTIGYMDSVIEGLLKTHNPDGTLKNDIILSQVYPVGSIYITAENKNPQQWLGGTWEAFAKGKTLVGVNPDDTDFNAALKEGGAKTVTLTTDQMPKHTHGDRMLGSVSGSYQGYVPQAGTGYTGEHNTHEAGGNKPHDNMPPYITVYFWRRTA